MGLYGQEPITVSYNPVEFGGHKYSGSGDTICLVCGAFQKTHNQGVMWLYGREFIVLSHHPAKFGDHQINVT